MRPDQPAPRDVSISRNGRRELMKQCELPGSYDNMFQRRGLLLQVTPLPLTCCSIWETQSPSQIDSLKESGIPNIDHKQMGDMQLNCATISIKTDNLKIMLKMNCWHIYEKTYISKNNNTHIHYKDTSYL